MRAAPKDKEKGHLWGGFHSPYPLDSHPHPFAPDVDAVNRFKRYVEKHTSFDAPLKSVRYTNAGGGIGEFGGPGGQTPTLSSGKKPTEL